jgi:hypothetical protein
VVSIGRDYRGCERRLRAKTDDPQQTRRTNVRLPLRRTGFRATRVFFSYQPRKVRLGLGKPTHHRKSRGGRERGLRASPSHAHHVFPRSRRTAFAGHQRRLFPIEESFIGGFDRIGVNEKVAARSDDDEPPISGMTTGPKHSCHQLRRAECRNGLPLGKRQRTRPVERDAMRGRLSFLIHR